jgi:recombination protein RecR
MLNQLPALAQLIKVLQQVPYVASKNLYRITNYFLHMDAQKAEQFCETIRQVREKLRKCETCFCWREKEHPCIFCSSSKRDQGIVCVVESWYELLAIEKTQGYMGVYHVLGGVISPLEGISVDDLTIEPLIERIEHKNINEVILATNQTPEGEATAAFIARKLRDKNVVVSCLARGLPVGSSLEAMDRLTVYKALSERRPF